MTVFNWNTLFWLDKNFKKNRSLMAKLETWGMVLKVFTSKNNLNMNNAPKNRVQKHLVFISHKQITRTVLELFRSTISDTFGSA